MHLENFSLVHIRDKEKLLLVVKVQTAGRLEILLDLTGDVDLTVGPVRVHHEDGVLVGEQDVHLGEGELGPTHLVLELVPLHTAASVVAVIIGIVDVLALLVAEAPLLALVAINAGPTVRGHLLALGADAGAALQGALAVLLASQAGAQVLG